MTTNKGENMSKRKSARKKKVTDASNVSSKKLSSSKVEVEPELEVEKESFACLFCTKVFCFRQRLNRYLKEHKYPGKFKCGVCRRFFATKKEKNERIELKHEKKIMCVYCGKLFPRNYTLNVNMICVHKTDSLTDLNIYTCTFGACDRRFTKEARYLDHMNVYMEVQPYECIKCKKPFHDRRYVKANHEYVCTGRKVFQCPECEQFCTSNYGLRKHFASKHKGSNLPLL